MSFSNRIIYPYGGCGNLIRWMLFLDDSFQHLTLKEKLWTIATQVYNKSRDWKNFSQVETRHDWPWKSLSDPNAFLRTPTDYNSSNKLVIGHNFKNDQPEDLTLFVRIDNTDLLFNRMIHAWPETTQGSKNLFYENVTSHNQGLKSINESINKKILDCTSLISKELDPVLYNSIVSLFNFTNVYESAKKVHMLWYNAEVHGLEKFHKEWSKNSNFNEKYPDLIKRVETQLNYMVN